MRLSLLSGLAPFLLATLTVAACSSTEREFSGDGDGDGDGDVDGTGGEVMTGDGDTGGTTGGDGDTSTGGTTPDPDPTDDIAPEVVSFTPSDSAEGVADDTPIQIRFSEPMDRDSVEAALTVGSFDIAAVDLTWNSDSTMVSILPATGWEYAEGTSLGTVNANEYTILVSKAATDVSGNALETSGSATFSTLRRITRTLTPTDVVAADTYGVGLGNDPYICPSTDPRVGWWLGSTSGGTRYVYLAFNLGALGSSDNVVSVESAVFGGTQQKADSGFYPGGSVEVQQMVYGDPTKDTNKGVYDIFDLSTIETVGVLATSAVSEVSLDFTDETWEEWSGGTTNALYRLGHGESSPDGYAYSYFTCDGFSLEVTYLTP